MRARDKCEEYRNYCLFYKGNCEEYVKKNVNLLKIFFEWTEQKNISIENITKDNLREFVISRGALSRRYYHVKNMCKALRSFFEFLNETGINSTSPTFIKNMRSKPVERIVPTKEEWKVFTMQPDTTTLVGLRDRTAMEIFFSTGIRIGALSRIRIKDINLERKAIFVKEKGGVFLEVYLTENSIYWIKKYIKTLEKYKEIKSDDLLFNITTKTIRKRFELYSRRIGKRIHPHLIRHLFATLFIQNGADIRVVQELLGHKSIKTTQMYTHVNEKMKRTVYEKFHGFVE